MIAALFVEARGCYGGLPDVDIWPEVRDARKYAGPWPIVAHPPCERWGRYWHGGPSAKQRRLKGHDEGKFATALWAVRAFGGVLEHPEASAAWEFFGLQPPPRGGGWVVADRHGFTCCVEQGHYGHRARKATWLYSVGTDFRELTWGPSRGERLDEGFHTAAERRAARQAGIKPRRRLTATENIATPLPFRDLLLGLARSVGGGQ